MHVLLRYVAGRNRLEYSAQTEADFNFIRKYVNDAFLKPKTYNNEDHSAFGFFVRSLIIALSTELQLTIWIEIHALCQESTELKVSEKAEFVGEVEGVECVEVVKWIKEKLPYWKALLRCWDDITIALTSHVMEEHCDPDASRDIQYANRLLTSAQKELFSQLTNYISVWAQVIAKKLSNRCVRSRFLKTFLELVSLKDELLELWVGSDPSPLLEIRPAMPKFSSVVWTIRSAKKFASLVDEHPGSTSRRHLDIERTPVKDPWRILVYNYCTQLSKTITQEVIVDKSESTNIGNLLAEEFVSVLESLNNRDDKSSEVQWALTQDPSQVGSDTSRSDRKNVFLTRIIHNYIVQFVLNYASCTHCTQLITTKVRSPLLLPVDVDQEFQLEKAHDEDQVMPKATVVPRGSGSSGVHRISTRRDSGVGSLAKMIVLAGRVKKAWGTILVKARSPQKRHLENSEMSSTLTTPISSPLLEPKDNESPMKATAVALLKCPYLEKRIPGDEATELCSLILQTEELTTELGSLDTWSGDNAKNSRVDDTRAWKMKIQLRALIPLSSCSSTNSEELKIEEIQTTITSVADFIDFSIMVLKLCCNSWNNSLCLQLNQLKIQQHTLLTLLEILQVFCNWLSNALCGSIGKSVQKTLKDAPLTAQLKELCVLLRELLKLPSCETNKEELRFTDSKPPQEKELRQDFLLERGEAHKICYNPIYRDNTTASSYRYSLRRLHAETHSANTLEASASLHEQDLIAEDTTEASESTNATNCNANMHKQYSSHQLDLSLDNNTTHKDVDDQIQSNPQPTDHPKSRTNQHCITSVERPSSALIQTLQKSVFDVLGSLEGLMTQPSRLDDD